MNWNWTHKALSETESTGEKKELIFSSDVFVEIHIVRNEIAHEYLPEALYDIFEKVLVLTPHLLDGVERTIAYCTKYTQKVQD